MVEIEGLELELWRLGTWGIPTAETPGINTSAATIQPTTEKSGEADDEPFCNIERMKQD
jgi:hypothetical protein